MTPYIGCDYARLRLESLVDGELGMDEQVAVESHVRWCRTCAARIEDLQLIGLSIRRRSAVLCGPDGFDRVEQCVEAEVIGRVCAEREQAFVTRVCEQLTDLRLVLPAAGATLAVVLAVGVALAVLQLTAVEVPESLAARLEAMGSPGSERNPLRPDNRGRVDTLFARYIDSNHAGGISLPRALPNGNGIVLATIRESESAYSESSYMVSSIVSRDGRVIRYRILRAASADAGNEAAVHAAVRQSRFSPAQDPGGRPVAVELPQLFYFMAIQMSDPGAGALLSLPTAPVGAGAAPVLAQDEHPAGTQPSTRLSPIA